MCVCTAFGAQYCFTLVSSSLPTLASAGTRTTTAPNNSWHRKLVAERAQARKLLAVHKAAGGSWWHREEAAAAVGEAAQRLDGHHGSSSGLKMPWQWVTDENGWKAKMWVEPKGKGKGKGKDHPQEDVNCCS